MVKIVILDQIVTWMCPSQIGIELIRYRNLVFSCVYSSIYYWSLLWWFIINMEWPNGWSEGGVTRITINPWKSIIINWNWRKRCANKFSNWWTNSGDLLKVNFWVITFSVRNFCKNVSPNLFRLYFQYVKDVIHPKFYPHYILSCPLPQYTLS